MLRLPNAATDPHFAGASGRMLAFCQACCPRLEIEVPVDDQPHLVYWMYKGFVPVSVIEKAGSKFVLLCDSTLQAR